MQTESNLFKLTLILHTERLAQDKSQKSRGTNFTVVQYLCQWNGLQTVCLSLCVREADAHRETCRMFHITEVLFICIWCKDRGLLSLAGDEKQVCVCVWVGVGGPHVLSSVCMLVCGSYETLQG